MIQYAKDVETAAMAQEGVKATRSVSITKSEDHLLILATNGLDIEESRTMYSAGASVIAAGKNEMQISGEYSMAGISTTWRNPPCWALKPAERNLETGRGAARHGRNADRAR